MLGGNPNLIVMQTQPYVDGLVDEADKVETENKNLLADTDYPAPDAEQRALKKDYSTGPYDHAVLKNAYTRSYNHCTYHQDQPSEKFCLHNLYNHYQGLYKDLII